MLDLLKAGSFSPRLPSAYRNETKCIVGRDANNNIGIGKLKLANLKGHKLAHDRIDPQVIIEISQISKNNGSLTVKCEVEGKITHITVDTGASKSIIRSDMVERAKIFCKNKYILRTATGELMTALGEIWLTMKLADRRFDHLFVVADITDECIMGMDFMERNQIVLNIKERLLQIDNTEVPLHLTGEANNIGTTTVRLKEDVQILPYSETLTWAELDHNTGSSGPLLIESKIQNSLHNISVARTLVTTENGKDVPVRLMNISTEPYKLKKGREIGECQQVVMVNKCEDAIKDPRSSIGCKNQGVVQMLEEIQLELPGDDYQKAEELLLKYSSIFSENDDDYGRTSLVQHRINTGDAYPIRQPPRRLPMAMQGKVEEMLNPMQKNGIIEPSKSPWSSPIVLVTKKDGSLRFCVDYRRLNNITKKDSYPLPRIDDTLDMLSETTVFSTLDLKSGYWQVEVHPEEREKTAFTTGNGLWQFSVMPFGLCNAPATFERLMDLVLQGLNWKTCLVYLDDVIVIGKSFDEHLTNLQQIFSRIQGAGMKLNPKKCQLFKKEVTYLGHVVSDKGVHTDSEKTTAVEGWPIPTNVHELRSFLGLCTYYRRFVPNFANIAKPLHQLTEKKQEFVWTEATNTAFEDLKKRLCTAPILAYPRLDATFILDTDASHMGIGAVLSQKIDGEERVISYFSRVLGKGEKNYCITRKELLAVVEAIKHFHKFLYGKKFIIRTDHAALKWLLQFKNPEGQVARWMERLQAYEFQIEHRKGRIHGNADALSRRPCKEECKQCTRVEAKEPDVVQQIKCSVDNEWANGEIRDDQIKDDDLGKIINWMSSKRRPNWDEIVAESSNLKAYIAQWDSLVLKDGILARRWESPDGKSCKYQIVLPKCRVPKVLQDMHDGASGGHLGVNKTLAKIRERFYWIRCRSDIENWCKSCHACGASKGPHTATRGRLRKYNVGEPFERIAIDIAGPFPETQNGNKYVLVIMDYFSKWPEVFAIQNQEAVTVANMLVNNVVSRFGVPMELHSDQGRNFESHVFQEMCHILGINKTRTTPLHPQSDGMVERFNRTLKEFMAKVVDSDQRNWDQLIPLFLLAYRTAEHDTTGFTPAQIIFGRQLRLPCDIKYGTLEAGTARTTYGIELQERLDTIHRLTRKRLQSAVEKMKNRYDLRSHMREFHEADLVWLYNPQRRKGKSPKLQSDWEGPYHIIKRINDCVYRIRKTARGKLKVVHIDRLAPYNRREQAA